MSAPRVQPAQLRRSLFVLTGLALVALITGSPAFTFEANANAPATVTAAFTPNALDVTPGIARNAVLSVTNAGTVDATGLRVGLVKDAAVTARLIRAPAAVLAAGGSTAVTVAVSTSSQAPHTATVEAVVSYRRGTTSVTVVATLTLTQKAPPATAAPITVTTSVGSANLIQYQATDAFYTITNTSDRAQILTAVTASYPSFLVVSVLPTGASPVELHNGVVGLSGSKTLAPADSRFVHLRIDASHPLQPGDALVVLTVTTNDAVTKAQASTVASQKITLSVLGESGALQLLGVPALLFVPGIVFVVVLWGLWRFVFPHKEFTVSSAAGLEGKVVMWVFALLPSLAFPFLYPLVTEALGQKRDYRRAYGLDDILYVWLMAAVLAVLVWGVGVGAHLVSVRFWFPQEHDSAMTVLGKLGRRPWKRNLTRERGTAQDQLVFVLRRVGDANVLLTPRIVLSGCGTADATALSAANPDQAGVLYRYVKRHRDVKEPNAEHGAVRADYSTSGPMLEPTIVARSAFTPNARDSVVSLQ